MGLKQLGERRWLVDARLWRDGKEYRLRETVDGSKNAAKVAYDKLMNQLKIKFLRWSGSLTFASFHEVLAYYQEHHDTKPMKYFFDRLDKDLGAVRLCELRERYDRWVLIWKQEKTRFGHPPSAGTGNTFLSWAHAALQYAVTNKFIPENPLQGYQRLKETRRDYHFSDLDERNLLGVIDQDAPYLSALVRFALEVPVRTSELLAMRRGDVDLISGVIRSRVMKCGMSAWKPLPTHNAVVMEHLRGLPNDCDAVWYRKIGGQNRPITKFHVVWQKCLDKAGLKGMHFHDLRHTAITRLINAGTPEQIVAQVAGWTSTSMLKRYYHLDGATSLQLVRFRVNQNPTKQGGDVLNTVHFQAVAA